MSTVEDYIAGFPEQQATQLRKLSGLITAALPDAIAEIKWNVPAYSGCW